MLYPLVRLPCGIDAVTAPLLPVSRRAVNNS
jgi:hypothetical protein